MHEHITELAKRLVNFKIGDIYVVSPLKGDPFVGLVKTESLLTDNLNDFAEFLIDDIYPTYGSMVSNYLKLFDKLPESWRNIQKTLEGFFTAEIKRGGAVAKTLTKEKLTELYLNQNKSLEDISRECHCSRQMIRHLMERYGIERRRRSEARVLAIKRGKFAKLGYHDINEDFFAVWSPQMAWVLGLLFTDGNIQSSKDRADGQGTGFRVTLCSIDLEMLENVRKHLGSTKPIKKDYQSYDRTKHIYELSFFRKKNEGRPN